MIPHYRVSLTLTLFLLTTSVTYAAGLVPCGGFSDSAMCTACDFVVMAQNIMKWFVAISASIVALVFALGGMKMVMSAGNTGAVSEAKEMMTNSVIGFLILLGAWLIVNTVLMTVMSDGKGIEVWGEIQCVPNPTMTATNTGGGSVTNTGGGSVTGGGTVLNIAQITQKYGTQINSYCSGSAISNCKDVVTALIAAESGGRTSVTSGAGAVGLMQLLPSNGGRNCEQNDTACIDSQIQKGIKMIESTYASTNSIPLTLASYNGGGAAIAPSGCCPSGYAYQCQYDCGGDKNYKQCTALSNVCTANTGFIETRNYVSNICKTIGGCK